MSVRHFRPFEWSAVAAVVVSSILFLPAAVDAATACATSRKIGWLGGAIAMLGWFVATVAPLALALAFRRLGRRIRWRGWLHLLFPVLAYGALNAGNAAILHVVGDPDFDATLGGPVMQAYVLFLFAIPAYGVSVVAGYVSPGRAR